MTTKVPTLKITDHSQLRGLLAIHGIRFDDSQPVSSFYFDVLPALLHKHMALEKLVLGLAQAMIQQATVNKTGTETAALLKQMTDHVAEGVKMNFENSIKLSERVDKLDYKMRVLTDDEK